MAAAAVLYLICIIYASHLQEDDDDENLIIPASQAVAAISLVFYTFTIDYCYYAAIVFIYLNI